MNKTINKFLLKQPVFTYIACGPLTKHCEKIQKFRETSHLKHLYRNWLDKACFANDAAYCESKNLAKRTISDKILKDRAYEIAKNCGYDGYERALASMVYKSFDKTTGSGVIATSKAGVSVNGKLAEELDKPVIEKFIRWKIYARFKNNVWAADLGEIGSLSSKNKNVKYLLCVIDVFFKYAWVKLLKDKKGKRVPKLLMK